MAMGLAAFVDAAANDAPWTERGNCRGRSHFIFFPDNDDRSTKEAKKICSMCEVQEECLDHAIELNEKHGIWGGMTEKERRIERRRRNAQKRANK